jgi:anti-anti-sigma factor
MSWIEVERRNGIPVARPLADIDAANAAAMREELAACIVDGPDTLVVDLSDTKYVDSAGLDMLLRLGALLDDRRARLILVIPPESQLSRLAAIVGLPVAIPVHATVEDGLAANAERAAPIPDTAADPEHAVPEGDAGQ